MISWYLNRLKTMSPEEMIYRLFQMLTAKYEQLFHAGRSPSEQKVTYNKIRFSYKPGYSVIHAETINVFGKIIDYPAEEKDWHKDVFSGNHFPVTFSKAINIRNNPALSAKNVWEVNRLQFLIFIALNYNHTGSEKYLRQFTSILSSWIESNPYLLGVNWYSNIEVNIRLIVWYFCWHLLDAEKLSNINPAFKDFVGEKWIPSIYQHCRYSYRNPSRYSSSNNHLISEYAGLFIASSLWNFRESEKWNRYAKLGLEKEIFRQHSINGINREEAAEYIQFITDFFLLAFVTGENSGNPFSGKYREQLRMIFTYIYNFTDMEGNFPQYGDEDDGKCVLFDQAGDFNNFKSLLTSGAIMFNDPVFKSKSNGIDTKNLILFGDDVISKFEKIQDQKSAGSSVFYTGEGHFLFRKKEENGEIYMHFDAAPLGYLSIAAHGHADALSFILHIDGQPVFTDPGTYTYHTEPGWRKYFIGTLAHNTIRINKLNQATIGGPTLWLNHYKTEIIKAERTGSIETVRARHDGYKSLGITHIREIIFNRDKMQFNITDEIITDNDNSYLVEFALHIHPLMEISEKGNNTIFIGNTGGKRGAMIILDNKLPYELVRGRTEPEISGWYSKSFMQKEPSTMILCSLETAGATKFGSMIGITP